MLPQGREEIWGWYVAVRSAYLDGGTNGWWHLHQKITKSAQKRHERNVTFPDVALSTSQRDAVRGTTRLSTPDVRRDPDSGYLLCVRFPPPVGLSQMPTVVSIVPSFFLPRFSLASAFACLCWVRCQHPFPNHADVNFRQPSNPQTTGLTSGALCDVTQLDLIGEPLAAI